MKSVIISKPIIKWEMFHVFNVVFYEPLLLVVAAEETLYRKVTEAL